MSEDFSCFVPQTAEPWNSLTELAVLSCPASDCLFLAGRVYCYQEVGCIAAYLEQVILLRFLVDYLLIQGTNRLSGFRDGGVRAAAAAVLGALYGGACLLPDCRFLAEPLWAMSSMGIRSAVAFGLKRSGRKRAGIFLLFSVILEIISLSFLRGAWPSLALGAGGAWLAGRAAFGDGFPHRQLVPLELSYGDNTVRLTALRDTGNNLRDPVTGEQVLVLSADAAEHLTGLTAQQLHRPLETMADRVLPGLRLIPYRAVGTAGGFLLGLRLEKARIGGRQRSIIAAFAPEGLGEEGRFQALAGGML